jgi:hypothetical protein
VPYLPPTISDFKAQFVRDFGYATPLSVSGIVGATGTAVLSGSQSVASITLVTAGSGQADGATQPVVIYGGGGVNATATIAISGGVASAFTVANAGFGYPFAPLVYVPIGGDNTNTEKVTDYDIARALSPAGAFNFNAGLFASQGEFTYAAGLLAAHYLVASVVAGTTGLGGKANWLTSDQSGGNVSQSFEIPERIKKSPYLALLSKTPYGMQFLELVLPQLIGNMQVFPRRTLP